ncbi:MAG TPA: AgmX/PglI C-terminal domain-containing protein, partial [Kofleriaceae bacterium]
AWAGPWGNLLGDDGGIGGLGEVGVGGLGLRAGGSGGGAGSAIDIGRLGTIGHGRGEGHIGAGFGNGHGRFGGRADDVAMTEHAPVVTGDYDLPTVRRYLRRNAPKLRSCYAKTSLARPGLHGEVKTTFTIGSDGQVTGATATGVDPDIDRCIAGVLDSIEVPHRPTHGAVSVAYAVTLGEPPPAQPADDSPKPTTAEPASPGFAAYRTPAASPLAAAPVDAELRACLDKAPPGVALIDLSYGADDAVTSAVERGGLDATLARCLETAARHARRTPIGAGKPASERCAIAFGATPAGTAPGLDLTADALRLDGAAIATRDELAAPAPLSRLSDKLTAERGAAPLAIRGPLVVRVADAVPYAAVRHVIATLISARRDFVLAAVTGGQWRLLSPVELPVVPVPAGVDGNWGLTSRSGDARPRVSLLVRRSGVWIALPAGEPAEVPHERVAPTLEAGAKGAGPELELAADDDASYGQLAAAITAAGRAGLPAWKLVPVIDLHPHP